MDPAVVTFAFALVLVICICGRAVIVSKHMLSSFLEDFFFSSLSCLEEGLSFLFSSESSVVSYVRLIAPKSLPVLRRSLALSYSIFRIFFKIALSIVEFAFSNVINTPPEVLSLFSSFI